MRKLMWFTIGFAAATALCAYLLAGSVILYIALFCGLFGTAFFLIRKSVCAIVALIALGICVGMLYYWGYDGICLAPIKQKDGKQAWVDVEATDYSFETEYGTAVDGKSKLDGQTYRLRLYLNGDYSIEPGDTLSGAVRLRYTPKGGQEGETYHKGEGIFLLCYGIDAMEHIPGKSFPMQYLSAWLRNKIIKRLETVFPKDTACLAKALLLGDDNDISFADNISFQKSGIRHIIAVSGLHISILFSFVYFVTGRKRYLTLFVGYPLLLLFAAVIGFTPSVTRACIMQALMILSVAADKEYDPATALAVACLVILAGNPLAVTSVSFQLSVGCMIGIFAFSQRIRQMLQKSDNSAARKRKSLKARLSRWFVGSVSISVSAMIVTVPFCAYYFGMVSIIGIVANLMVLWLLPFVFFGICFTCFLSLLWIPGACVIAQLFSVPMRFVLFVARFLAKVPFSVAYTDSPYTVLWIVFLYGVLMLYIFCKKKRPLLLAGSIVLAYGLSLFLTWAVPYRDDFRLTMVDVGQGQCVLLQSKGSSYLIDCGGDDPQRTASAAIKVLGANGISKLDGLILTHYDEDHANGAYYLLQSFSVDALYLPDTDASNVIRRKLSRSDIPIQWIDRNKSVPCGAGSLRMYPAKKSMTGNESSMCILFQATNCDILITGDRNWNGEQMLLQELPVFDIDILVAGHHGAATSNSVELITTLRPELVLISVGEGNIYGHPDPDTIARFLQSGCEIRRTDLEGTILIRG